MPPEIHFSPDVLLVAGGAAAHGQLPRLFRLQLWRDRLQCQGTSRALPLQVQGPPRLWLWRLRGTLLKARSGTRFVCKNMVSNFFLGKITSWTGNLSFATVEEGRAIAKDLFEQATYPIDDILSTLTIVVILSSSL